MLMTTGNSFDGYYVTEYLGLVHKDAIFINGFRKTIKAAIDNFVDSFTFQDTSLSGSERLMENARKSITKQFEEEAKHMGANAILGIDYEWTIGDQVIQISVNGTAVKVSKLEEPVKQVMSKTVQVMNYSCEIAPRLCQVMIKYDKNTKLAECRYDIAFWKSEFSAVEIKTDFFSMGGERILSDSSYFDSINMSDHKWMTEWSPLDISVKEFKQITSVKAEIMALMKTDGSIQKCSYEYCSIEFSPAKLADIRKIQPIYVVRESAESDSCWHCSCGKDNPKESHDCPLCGRSMEKIKDIIPVDEQIKSVFNHCSSVTEIYALIQKNTTEIQLVESKDLLALLESYSNIESHHTNDKFRDMRNSLRLKLREQFKIEIPKGKETEEEKEWKCPKCGAMNESGWSFCHTCMQDKPE